MSKKELASRIAMEMFENDMFDVYNHQRYAGGVREVLLDKTKVSPGQRHGVFTYLFSAIAKYKNS